MTRQLSERPPVAAMVPADISRYPPGKMLSVIVHDSLLACRGEDGERRVDYQGLSSASTPFYGRRPDPVQGEHDVSASHPFWYIGGLSQEELHTYIFNNAF